MEIVMNNIPNQTSNSEQSDKEELADYFYMSAHKSVRAKGLIAKVTTPAFGEESENGAFQKAIAQAFSKARELGQENPILIGAIPFDLTQETCLYVPSEYAFFEKDAFIKNNQSQPVYSNLIEKAKSVPDEITFKRGVKQAIANFEHSDIQKAVLSRVYEVKTTEPVNTQKVMLNLLKQNPVGYHFKIPLNQSTDLIGASPELLLRKEGETIFSNPLAGSAKRLSDQNDDKANANALVHSSKDNFEHKLVIDDVRRVLTPHCVSLEAPLQPELMSTTRMWHLSTQIKGQLKNKDESVLALACQLHPTPAVCGYPTGLARKLISLVEPFERGLFTGMVGWCDAQGNGEWVVTIRCGTVSHDQIRLFAGAGIVEASSPEAEWLETQAKLATMMDAFGFHTTEISEGEGL